MANNIHTTAVLGPQVKLGENIVIGPYVVIDGDVTIGNGTEIATHATILGTTKIGSGNRIFPHASIGTDPQDKKHDPKDPTTLEIGDGNLFREFVTINRGTIDGGGVTRIGDRNLFMAYTHVAHDCIVGNDCVMANLATLGGHVVLGDRAVVGGMTGVHQFVKIGKMAMVGGCSKLTQDMPPFGLCDGNPAFVFGLNSIGLRRAQVASPSIKLLKEAYRILFFSGLAKATAVERVEKELGQDPNLHHLLEFVNASERGLLKGQVIEASNAE